MRVAVGDVGGTKTLLAVAEVGPGGVALRWQRRFASREFAGLEQVLRECRGELEGVRSACFAVAGPVQHNRCVTTNLPWSLDGDALARDFGWERATLINDFVAVGEAVGSLRGEELVELKPGVAVPGAPRAVLGAGTGLGHAFLVPRGEGYTVLPSEAGHVDFAPRTSAQRALLEWLVAQGIEASVEAVCSGLGLANLARFVRESEGVEPGAAVRDALASGADVGAVLGPAGLARSDAMAARVLALFAEIYAQTAANVALMAVATGGVYLGGGVTLALLPLLREGAFAQRFAQRKTYGALLAAVPVHAIAHAAPGLVGAAVVAARV